VTIYAKWTRNSSGGRISVKRYPVSVSDVENGVASSNLANAVKGDTVVVSLVPKEGYQVTGVTVSDAKGNNVAVTNNGDGNFTFTMPGNAVTVTPEFTEVKQQPDNPDDNDKVCPRDDTCPMTPFTDTNKNEWYHDGVHWAIDQGLMNGTGDHTFEPSTAANRAMMVTILWRMEGSPKVDQNITFKDVPDGQWYTEAIRWAVKNGIVNGYSEDKFGTADDVTREQIVTILYRYAQSRGINVSQGENINLSKYNDTQKISDWADKAFRWAVGTGIIQGMSDTILSPGSNAVRAQIATMLMRFKESA
jgi:hypothetical protein